MRQWIIRVGLILAAILIITAAYLYYRLHDRYPGYTLDLHVPESPSSTLWVGFSARSITPDVPDTWVDVNNDFRFSEKDGDTYEDRNGNGRFDPVWIAGFHNQRPAQGVNDSLWARTVYIHDGTTSIALTSIDAIGLGADDILEVRKKLEQHGLTWSIVSSTHTHQSPDLIGLYGKNQFSSGVDPDYMRMVKTQIETAVLEARDRARPSSLSFAQDLDAASKLVDDSRMPYVLDPGVRVMHARDLQTGEALGTLVAWANHPETLTDVNLLISSDFPHYVRRSIEKGVRRGDSLLHEGLGGIAVYVNGSIGGLMTTWSDFPIVDPFTQLEIVEPTFAKAEAQGQQLALIALRALNENPVTITEGSIQLRAVTVELPLDNRLYRLGAVLGLFSRGLSGWWKIRTEVAAWRLGPATFLHQPGELYPEIANGGIETPNGNDYALDAPVEVPPLRELMPGEFKFIIGLSNDMIGYILPLSQWDEKPPFTYGQEHRPYGEINSVGPQTGPILHRELSRILRELR